MPSIALTGGFGTGKTTVLRHFKKLGASTVEIDRIVHDILKRHEIIKKITALLGDDVLKKSPKEIALNKKVIAEKIFNDSQKRKAVEKIIHPLVLKEIKKIISRSLCNETSSITVFEVPLLFEARFERYFDRTVVVYCDRKTVIKRLIKKGFSEGEAIKRIRAQLPVEKKVMFADFVIDNSDGAKRTERQIKHIFKTLKESL